MPFAIAIHGGAGTILKTDISPEQELAYKAALKEALFKGWEVLNAGGSALEAVTQATISLENCPLFNAGKGAVFTHEGGHELDAALMDGHSGKAGAVAGVKHIKNPILAAKAVMEHTDHILLVGEGAERLASQHNLDLVEPDYFSTPFRYDQLQAALAEGRILLDHDGKKTGDPIDPDHKFGTVGAVAVDSNGNCAAATSTGGMTNKRYNRVGDSPIIGAGTWADDRIAISATGHGEVFIRNVVAYDIAARIKYKGQSFKEACNATILDALGSSDPDSGGIIAVSSAGEVCLPFNTEGMYRAWATAKNYGIGIYGTEDQFEI